jgi:cell division protease FtsH
VKFVCLVFVLILLFLERLAARGQLVSALTSHETMLCADLIFAEDLEISFKDVAGLDEVKEGLQDVIKLVKTQGGGGTSKLRAPPKGLLLHGPPGNGKVCFLSLCRTLCSPTVL